MVPSVISDFVAMLRDGGGAFAVFLGPISSDKERAVDISTLQRRNQIIETVRIRAGVEGKRNLGMAARAPRDFTKRAGRASNFFLALRSDMTGVKDGASEAQIKGQ